MELNRFIRILWTINGILLFLVFVFILVAAGIQFIQSFSSNRAPEIIVGEELAKAKKEGLILQGLTYSQPEKIYGHPNYLLTVSIQTFNTPKRIENPFDGDKRSKLKVDHQESRLVNIIFLNKDFEPITKLLDKKAFIHSVEFPTEGYSNNGRRMNDSLRSVITYVISTTDSNQDGILNDDDDADFYVSTCDGTQFSQITKGWNIKDHSFVSLNEILIKYTLRTEEEEEHKKVFFALYNTQQKSLKELSALHKTLDEIEAHVTQ